MLNMRKVAWIILLLLLGTGAMACSKRIPMTEYIRMNGTSLPKDVRMSTFGDEKVGIMAFSRVYVLVKREVRSKGEKETVFYQVPVMRNTQVPPDTVKMTVYISVENPRLRKYKLVKFTEIDGRTEEEVILEKTIADVKELQVDCPIIKQKKVSIQIKLILLEGEGLTSTKGLEVASLHYSS